MANDGSRGVTLVVLAAGLGKRFGGPKQVEAVGPSGEILLDYSVYDALRAGFSRVVFVVRDDVEDILRRRLAAASARCEMTYVTQRQDDVPPGHTAPGARARPWGTGHAVWACRNVIEGPFGVVNADDFYGAPAFETMAQFLEGANGPRAKWVALVGYRLSATLTPHGEVSRGVCEVDSDGRLVRIVERHGVQRRGIEVGYSDRGAWHSLNDDDVASMNFWGFAPTLFPLLEREFALFLRSGPSASDEFGLPTAVTALLETGDIDARVIPSPAASWLGVTHREDLGWAREAMRRRVAAGDYPSPLWGRR